MPMLSPYNFGELTSLMRPADRTVVGQPLDQATTEATLHHAQHTPSTIGSMNEVDLLLVSSFSIPTSHQQSKSMTASHGGLYLSNMAVPGV